jgi:hypothetical protein
MTLIIVAPIMAVALFLVILAYADDDRFVIYGAVFLLAGAYWMINVGRRMRAVDGWELLRSDPRPPVVYLRPFQEDQRRRYHDPVGDRQGGETAGPNSSTQATREPKIGRKPSRRWCGAQRPSSCNRKQVRVRSGKLISWDTLSI